MITDKSKIYKLLDDTAYGTLALSFEDKPYSVAVNFVRIEDDIYFHGALKNKKMKMLSKNPHVSFSVVKEYSIIDSDFSSLDGLACPATHFFSSISIDGVASIVEERSKKIEVFTKLMEKLQPKGGYKPFSDSAYDKAIKATAIVKIEVKNISEKHKLGQNLSKERFEMIISNLENRSSNIDKETINMMKKELNHAV